jgi:hypothetical protein
MKISLTITLLLISFCISPVYGQKAGKASKNKKKSGVLLFNSGFENGSRVVPKSASPSTDDDIAGKDLSVSGPNDWEENIDKSPNLGFFNLQYQGGDTTMRFARIIPEPGNPKNKVLHFWVNQPNVDGTKARIQANIYADKRKQTEGIKELYQSVRLFLPADMEVVKSFPEKISWLTILEVWNNIQWVDDPYPYRLTVGIGKPTGDKSELHFIVDAEDYDYSTKKYIKLWHDMNKTIAVPIGKWFTLEYYMKEGNAQSGRFYMAITPEGGKKQVIFDITNFTHNTKDPNPDGITLWNPMKLYTSKKLVDYARGQGKALQIYWDDFSVWKNRLP